MNNNIPSPLISILASSISQIETHATLESLFLYANAPVDPPLGSKEARTIEWLRRINKECDQPLSIVGKLIENYMENPEHINEFIVENYTKRESLSYPHVKK
jgi:hypothetical protein